MNLKSLWSRLTTAIGKPATIYVAPLEIPETDYKALWPKNREIRSIIVHHSASAVGTTADDIRRMHTSKCPNDPSKPWTDVGYHELIEDDGKIVAGRPVERPGAGVAGHNRHTIHVCLVGDGRRGFSDAQMKSLASLLRQYRRLQPGIDILGHNDLANTLCPAFDLHGWLRQNGF